MTFHPFKVGAFTHSTKHPLQPSSAHIANQYIPVPYRYNLQSDIPSILIEKGCEICHPFTSLFCSRFNPLDTTLQYHHHHHSPRLYVNRQSLAGREKVKRRWLKVNLFTINCKHPHHFQSALLAPTNISFFFKCLRFISFPMTDWSGYGFWMTTAGPLYCRMYYFVSLRKNLWDFLLIHFTRRVEIFLFPLEICVPICTWSSCLST